MERNMKFACYCVDYCAGEKKRSSTQRLPVAPKCERFAKLDISFISTRPAIHRIRSNFISGTIWFPANVVFPNPFFAFFYPMKYQYLLLCSFFVVACTCWSGCSRVPRPADLPDLYPCQLTISQDGKPLEKANVTLYPDDSKSKWTVGGTTDSRGIVTILTHAQFPGAPAGEYKIVVSKTESYQERPAQPKPGGDGTEMIPGTPIQIFGLVELQYIDIKTTPLTMTVKKGKNSKDIDVGKAIREKIAVASP